MKRKIETEVYRLPAFWACPLINDDYSGLEDEDINQIKNWLSRVNPGSCSDVSEEHGFGVFEGLGHDLAEFTFIKYAGRY